LVDMFSLRLINANDKMRNLYSEIS